MRRWCVTIVYSFSSARDALEQTTKNQIGVEQCLGNVPRRTRVAGVVPPELTDCGEYLVYRLERE